MDSPAFTVGTDIHLGAGEADDPWLLAHEATHVAQQQGVATGMAETIVHQLEVVEIEHKDGEVMNLGLIPGIHRALVLAFKDAEQPTKRFVCATTVVKPGEGISHRCFSELGDFSITVLDLAVLGNDFASEHHARFDSETELLEQPSDRCDMFCFELGPDRLVGFPDVASENASPVLRVTKLVSESLDLSIALGDLLSLPKEAHDRANDGEEEKSFEVGHGGRILSMLKL